MPTLPKRIIQVLRHFEGVFSERVWEWAKVLVIGAILAPGERTVAAILRVMGQQNEKQFQNYHRVLNRAKWSSREVSRRVAAACWFPFLWPEMRPSWSGSMKRLSAVGAARLPHEGSIVIPCVRARSSLSKRVGCVGFP